MERTEDKKMSGTVEIYIDNMTVVNRLREEEVTDNETTDSDLWRLSLTLMKEIQTIITIQHVKAHQDLIIGPMSWQQMNNTIVDSLAKEGTKIEDDYSQHDIPGSEMTIKIKDMVQTGDYYNSLYRHIAGRPIREYVMGKFGWSNEIFDSIDWDAFEEYTRSIPNTKIANIIKLSYDWQFTRHWEEKSIQRRVEEKLQKMEI